MHRSFADQLAFVTGAIVIVMSLVFAFCRMAG
jgi:hypothetical protein